MAQHEAERRRVALRLHPDLHERVKYWADKEGVSINEWIMSAIEGQIARANGDYDLPTAEIARLNQLVDGYDPPARRRRHWSRSAVSSKKGTSLASSNP